MRLRCQNTQAKRMENYLPTDKLPFLKSTAEDVVLGLQRQ